MKKAFIVFLIYFILLTALGVSVFAQRLTLEETVSLTLANNPEIKSLELEVVHAQKQTAIVRGTYLPQISFAGVANHYFQRPVFFGFGDQSQNSEVSFGRFGGDDQLSAGLVLDQAIWNPRVFPAVRAARFKEKETDILVRQKKVALVSEVKETYLKLLILQERIRLKKQNIDRNAKVLSDSRILLAQGKALRVDTLRAFTSLKNLEPGVLRLQNELQSTKLRILALIGIDTIQDFMPGDSLTIPVPKKLPEESEVYAIAQENNPSMQGLNLQESLTQQSVKQASAARLPVLSATAQYFITSQTNNFDYTAAPFPATSYVGVRLFIPIFSGFALNSGIQQATIRKQESNLALENARKTLRADVHDLVSRYNESLQRIAVAKDVNETAGLTFRIVQYRYKNGIASRLELTDTELALTEAQSNYLEAIYEYLTTRIHLLAVMGTIE